MGGDRNVQIMLKGVRGFTTKLRKRVLRASEAAARDVVGEIDYLFMDDSDEYPQWSANMHDGTGVAVLEDGAVRYKGIPTRRARGAQSYAGRKNIWGGRRLRDRLGTGLFAEKEGGVEIKLVSAVPYAWRINAAGSKWGRGAGYFEKLSGLLLGWVKDALKAEGIKIGERNK